MNVNADFLSRVNKTWKVEERLSFVYGMIYMALSDAKVTIDEAQTLQRWLVSVQSTGIDDPVMFRLLQDLDDCLSDGELSPKDAERLVKTFTDTVTPISHLGELQTTITLPITEPQPEVIFSGKEFVLTGEFTGLGGVGRETFFTPILVKMGASLTKRLSRNSDYLVLGTYSSASYRQGNYGSKITRGMRWRDKHDKPQIISESHFLKALKLREDKGI